MLNEKRCNKCGELKPHTEFHGRALSKDGVTPQCKICRNESHRLYSKTHPEIRREQRRRYRETNPEKIRKYRRENRDLRNEQGRRWRERYPEKVKEIYRRYYLNNTDKVAGKNRIWRENNQEKSYLMRYRNGDGCCLYCWEITPWMLNNHHPWKKIDRDFTITLCENHHALFTRGVSQLLEDWRS